MWHSSPARVAGAQAGVSPAARKHTVPLDALPPHHIAMLPMRAGVGGRRHGTGREAIMAASKAGSMLAMKEEIEIGIGCAVERTFGRLCDSIAKVEAKSVLTERHLGEVRHDIAKTNSEVAGWRTSGESLTAEVAIQLHRAEDAMASVCRPRMAGFGAGSGDMETARSGFCDLGHLQVAGAPGFGGQPLGLAAELSAARTLPDPQRGIGKEHFASKVGFTGGSGTPSPCVLFSGVRSCIPARRRPGCLGSPARKMRRATGVAWRTVRRYTR